MRLVRIEAGRFGKIDGRTLGDLSPGLTVVHGPNEAGKSSLTALVRHVLYGFPTPASAEAPYLSHAGAREGRLVFADDDGEWVVERKEGVRGGPVTVRTLSGRSRDGLVDELTSGVSRLAYRVVFGFGLAEMHQIEELKGKDDDLLARLYAAGAGLTVSPMDVRAKIQAAMDALWAKRASNPELNRAKSRRDELRAEIRTLEAATDTVRADSSRLETMERELEVARVRRIETQAAAEACSMAEAERARLRSEADSLATEASRLSAQAAAVASKAAQMPSDVAAVSAAATVDALAAELSGFRERLASLAEAESRLSAVETRLRVALDDVGWTEQRALSAAADAGIGAEIDARRDALAKARGRLEAATDARSRVRAEGAVTAAPAAANSPLSITGLAIAFVALVAGVALLIVSQPVFATIAGVVAVAGAVVALLGRRSSGAHRTGAADPQRLAAAESECAAAESSVASLATAWSEWIVARGYGDGSEDPGAIAARYQAARTVSVADTERTGIRESCARERERLDGYVQRVRDVIAPLLGESPDAVAPDRVAELVGRAVARTGEARSAAAARIEAIAVAERISDEAAAAQERASAAAVLAGEAAPETTDAGHGVAPAAPPEVLARAAAAQALEEFDRLSREAAELRALLGTERREGTLSALRLEEETLGEQISAGVRDYAVLAVAANLLDSARERYERDRQPEVVKRAEEAFAAMTNGRYRRLAVPLGRDAIEVFDGSAAATSPGRLSRGTAEQLYLALRLGLIEQLGDVGRGLPVLMDDILVDFSPNRLEPAARAIADLATRRQVVFLTCHPSTADLLCSVAPNVVRLELGVPA